MCFLSYWNEICHSTNFRMINNLTCLCVILCLCIHMCCQSWVVDDVGGCIQFTDANGLYWIAFPLLFTTSAVCHFLVGVVLQSSLWSLFLDAFPVDLFVVLFYQTFHTVIVDWLLCMVEMFHVYATKVDKLLYVIHSCCTRMIWKQWNFPVVEYVSWDWL